MIKTLLVIAIATVGIGTPALAEMPGRGWIASGKVKAMLAKRGYRMTRIEADDGHWEGEAVRRQARYEFHVDPHSGRVTKLERDRHR